MERRALFRLTAAGLAGVAVADGKHDFPAEAQEAREESFMMLPGNYTWPAAVRGAVATSLWGGSDLGVISDVFGQSLRARARLNGNLRNDQGVRRLLENYRNDPESIDDRAASGKRRKTPAGCSGEPHDLRDHLGGVGGTRGRIHKTSCSVVISARRE